MKTFISSFVSSDPFQKATVIQRFFLTYTGITPICRENDYKIKTYYSRLPYLVADVLTGLWLIGGWVSFCLNAAIAIGSLANPDPNLANLTSTMQAFVMLPYASYNFRAVVVLTIVVLKRRSWREMQKTVSSIIMDNFSKEKSLPIKKWLKLGIIMALVTVVLLVIWEVLYLYQTMDTYSFTLYSDGILSPLPIHCYVWQYVIIWTVFSTIPFYVSQQVYITFLITAEIFRDCCDVVKKDIEDEFAKIESWKNTDAIDKSNDAYVAWMSESTMKKLVGLKRRYIAIYLACHYININFGSVLFFIYGVDLLTLFGSLAGILTLEQTDTAKVTAFYFVSAIIFLSYCTVFLWPLVRMYEKCLRINKVLHTLMHLTEEQGGLITFQGKNLHTILQTFILTTKDQLIMFSGAEVLHLTRTFVFTTFTMMVSFLVIAKEIFHRDMELGAHAAQAAHAIVTATLSTVAPVSDNVTFRATVQLAPHNQPDGT